MEIQDSEGMYSTGRQAEILRMAADGLTDKAIAANLGISTSTVNSHFRRLFAKYGTNSRTKLVAMTHGSLVVQGQKELEARDAELASIELKANQLQDHLDAVADLLDIHSQGVLIEDASRRIRYINRTLLALLHIGDVDPCSLLGSDSLEFIARVRHAFRHPIDFLNVTTNTFETHMRAKGQILPLSSGQTLIREFIPIRDGGSIVGCAWVYEPAPTPGPTPTGYPHAARAHSMGQQQRREAMAGAVERTALGFAASAASVWRLNTDGSGDMLVAWRAENSSLKPSSGGIAAEDSAWWVRALANRHVLECGDLTGEPVGSPIRKVLEVVGGEACSVCGTWDGPDLIGCVAFVCDKAHPWTPLDRLMVIEAALFVSFLMIVDRFAREE